jgi:hypothetical protein
LWQCDSVEALPGGDQLWLRWGASHDLLEQVKLIPGGQLFEVIGHGQLVPYSFHVPTGELPEGQWLPLRKWLSLTLPLARISSNHFERAPLTLVREDQFSEPQIVLTDVQTWHNYAITAPQIRLDRWTFAVSARGQVVVRGLPLPPLRGERLVERDGIATIAGWRWSPAMEAKILAKAFGLAEGDVLLWLTSDHYEIVRAGDFVKATRQAARLSLAGVNLV